MVHPAKFAPQAPLLQILEQPNATIAPLVPKKKMAFVSCVPLVLSQAPVLPNAILANPELLLSFPDLPIVLHVVPEPILMMKDPLNVSDVQKELFPKQLELLHVNLAKQDLSPILLLERIVVKNARQCIIVQLMDQCSVLNVRMELIII